MAQTVSEAHRRAGELVARYGGEEFAVLIPNVSLEDTAAAAREVRARVEALGLPHPDSPAAPVVTVSVGAAWATPSADAALADLLDMADRALYRAKQGGRNRAEAEIVPRAGDAQGA